MAKSIIGPITLSKIHGYERRDKPLVFAEGAKRGLKVDMKSSIVPAVMAAR